MFWNDDETPEKFERRQLQDMMEIVNRIDFYTLGQRAIEWRKACEKMADRLDGEEINEAMREDIDEIVWDADSLSVDLSSLADFINHKMSSIEKAAREYDKRHNPDLFDDE
jgi:hypothetical protein